MASATTSPDLMLHLGSHYCTARTVRDFDGDLRQLLCWYDADQPCPTSAAQVEAGRFA